MVENYCEVCGSFRDITPVAVEHPVCFDNEVCPVLYDKRHGTNLSDHIISMRQLREKYRGMTEWLKNRKELEDMLDSVFEVKLQPLKTDLKTLEAGQKDLQEAIDALICKVKNRGKSNDRSK